MGKEKKRKEDRKAGKKKIKRRKKKERRKKKKEGRRRKNKVRRKRKKERRKEEKKKDQEETYELRETNTAIRGFAKKYTIKGRGGIDSESFLNKVQLQVIDLLLKNRPMKVMLVLTCVMERVETKTGEVITASVPFRSKTEIILETTDLNEIYKNAVDKIKESIAIFQTLGSNWRFRKVVKLDIFTAKYKPLRDNSYIRLPKKLKNKKAIINPQNEEDEECFKWSITIALNYQDGQKKSIQNDQRTEKTS